MTWPAESYRHQLASQGVTSANNELWRSQADKVEQVKYIQGQDVPLKKLKRLGVLRSHNKDSVEDRIKLLAAIYDRPEQEIIQESQGHKDFDEFYTEVIFSEQQGVKHWYRYPEMQEELK